ncbi:MAG: glycosyltransferase family 9 protein [Nitrospirae bacterium]|nr:glycosyltransferase family 9 protein [Nitrospirota bacterium]
MPQTKKSKPLKILFIRRDNIGDLICTTPAIHAVREKFPEAKIGILVNTYNAAMIANNPDIDEIYIYEKAKHALDKSKLSVWWSNFRVLLRIRREHHDFAIGCGSYSPRLSRYTYMTGAGVKIGFSKDNNSLYDVRIAEPKQDMHEVERTFSLLTPLGINTAPGDMILRPDVTELNRVGNFIKSRIRKPGKPLLAVCISARIQNNKWPPERFINLIQKMLDEEIANVLLLWAPGTGRHPTFPGDDELADSVIKHFQETIIACPTKTLEALICAVGSSDLVLTLDTGSLHISAALKKTTVALMTKAKSLSWYPWRTRHTIITADGDVKDIREEDVYDSIKKMLPC